MSPIRENIYNIYRSFFSLSLIYNASVCGADYHIFVRNSKICKWSVVLLFCPSNKETKSWIMLFQWKYFLLPSQYQQHRLSTPVTPKIPLGLAKPIEILSHSPWNDLVTSGGYRIVNGSDATVNQFPWFVSVRAYTPRGLQSICGGSLISKKWVLTAGHCTHGYATFNLGLGSRNLNKPFISLTSDNVIEHARYNPNNLNNDVALIGLPKEMVFTAFVQAIRLPTLRQAITGKYHTEKARVCGFGRTTDGKFVGKVVVVLCHNKNDTRTFR